MTYKGDDQYPNYSKLKTFYFPRDISQGVKKSGSINAMSLIENLEVKLLFQVFLLMQTKVVEL